MKKVLLIAAVAAFAMTSCKKDRTCVCTTSYTYGGTTSVVVASNTQKSTKKGAEAWCEAKGTTTYDGVAVTSSGPASVCEVK
jgi:hypothetical protein